MPNNIYYDVLYDVEIKFSAQSAEAIVYTDCTSE